MIRGWLLPVLLLAPAAQAQEVAPLQSQPEVELFEWKWQPPTGTQGRFKIWSRLKGAQLLAPRRGGPSVREERVTVRTAEVDYETVSRDERGATVSRLVFRRITSATSLKRGGKSVPDPLAAAVARAEQALVGVEIDIKHGPDGEVWNVQGVQGPNPLPQRLRVAVAKVAAGQRESVSRTLEQRYGEATLRREWGTLASRPPQPVRTGEVWRSSWLVENSAAPLAVDEGPTHVLIAFTSQRAVIAHRISFASRATGGSGAVRTSGTIAGQAVIDRATGLPIEQASSLRGEARRGGRAFSWWQEDLRRVFTPRQ